MTASIFGSLALWALGMTLGKIIYQALKGRDQLTPPEMVAFYVVSLILTILMWAFTGWTP